MTTLPFEPSALLAVGDGVVAFTRGEQGACDPNADGDTSDLELHEIVLDPPQS